jgi:hypothetical protein
MEKQTKGCRKYIKIQDRHCGDKYGYYKEEERSYIKNKTGYDIWLCDKCENKIKNQTKPTDIRKEYFDLGEKQGRKETLDEVRKIINEIRCNLGDGTPIIIIKEFKRKLKSLEQKA